MTPIDISQFAWMFTWCGPYHFINMEQSMSDFLIDMGRPCWPSYTSRMVEHLILRRASDFAQFAIQQMACDLLNGEVA